MPFVRGFLRIGRRGRPDNTLPEPEGPVDPGWGIEEGGPVDPDWGIEEGAGIGGGPVLPPPVMWPKPPPGIWPPPEHPVQPLPPNHPMPPGSIWPPVIGGGPIYPETDPPVIGGGPAEPPPEVGGGPPGTKYLVAIVTAGRGGGKVIGYTVVDTSLRPMPAPHRR